MKIKEQLPEWRKLDNSAKIFPMARGKKYSTVFRFSVLLKENVVPEILEEAVNVTLEQYKYFKVKMKSGVFWNYLEENSKKVIIEEEKDYPCKYINPNTNNQYLFKFTYFEKKINIDIFHSLTDGNNGITFFKEVIYNYLELKYPKKFDSARKSKKLEFNTEDSYVKNYDKKSKSNSNMKSAYILKGKKSKFGVISAIHQILDLEDVKNEAKKHEATITQYLSAVLIYSIYEENYKIYNGKKPINLCIPVNLKKYFPSNTMSNFFSYIILNAEMKKNNLDSFEKILDFVKNDFKRKLEPDEIIKTMSANVRLGINPIIKIIPLFLKKIFVKLTYIKIRRCMTITYSNVGRVGVIGEYQDYIDYFLMLIAPESVEKIKCSSCTFGNKMVFTFTSILGNNSIEKRFYDFLREKGIKVEIESNGVLDDISREIK